MVPGKQKWTLGVDEHFHAGPQRMKHRLGDGRLMLPGDCVRPTATTTM